MVITICLADHSNPEHFFDLLQRRFQDENINFSKKGNDMVVGLSEDLPFQERIHIQSCLMDMNRENIILQRKEK